MSPQLIHDIIPLILDSHLHWWPRDLARLCRVSSIWLSDCRTRLYTYPEITSFHAVHLLARTLKSSALLRSGVQGVHLRIQDSSVLGADAMSGLIYLLGLELNTLTLGGELAVQAERFLNMVIHPETIRHLSIVGSFLGCEGCGYFQSSLEWDDVLSHKFSQLCTLELRHLELCVMTTQPPVQCTLSKLVLDQVDSVDGDLNCLVGVSHSSLKSVSIVTCVPEMYDEFAQALLPTLSSLQYQLIYPSLSTSIFDEMVEPLPSLHQLELRGIKLNPDFLTTMLRTCPNLRSLLITGREVQVDPKAWSDFISKSHLEQLHIPFGTLHPPFKPWTEEEIKLVLNTCSTRHLQVL